MAFTGDDGDGLNIRSNEVTVGFTLRFNRPRSGGTQTVEEELGLFAQPDDWTVAADATGGEVLLNDVAIADWIERLPGRFEANFDLPDGTAAAGSFDLSIAAGEREINAPTVTPGAGSPDEVAEVRLRRAFEGELDSEFEGGDAGVEVVASIRIESASPDRVVGRLTSTIVPPAGSPPADASTWRVSTGLHREDGSVVTSHGVPFGAPGAETLTFERPLQLPPGTDSAIVLAENLRDGDWGYAVVDFLDLVEQAVDSGTAARSRAISLRPEDPLNRRGRATFLAEVLDPFTDQVERVVFYFNGRRVAARNRAPYRARIDLGRGDRLGRVEAVAFDAEDRELDRHELLVNQPPHAFWVRITEPGEGLLAGPVEVAAELKLPRGGRLMEMRFFVKDRLAETATEEPFRREVLVPVGDPESYLRVEAQLTDGRIAEDVLFLSRPGLSARIGVELVQLYVVATDRSGQPVRDLTAADFAVFEDDRAQELESFRIAFDLPLTLGLAIDTSSSLFLRMPDVKRAAVEFLESLEPRRDRAFLVGFGTEPRLVRAATYNPELGAGRHRSAQAARPHRRLGRAVAGPGPARGSARPQGARRLLRRRRRGLRRRLPAEPRTGATRPGTGLPGPDERRGRAHRRPELQHPHFRQQARADGEGGRRPRLLRAPRSGSGADLRLDQPRTPQPLSPDLLPEGRAGRSQLARGQRGTRAQRSRGPDDRRAGSKVEEMIRTGSRRLLLSALTVTVAGITPGAGEAQMLSREAEIVFQTPGQPSLRLSAGAVEVLENGQPRRVLAVDPVTDPWRIPRVLRCARLDA